MDSNTSHPQQSKVMGRQGGQATTGAVTEQRAVAPYFVPTLTSIKPKSNFERLAEYRIKYAALTMKEAA